MGNLRNATFRLRLTVLEARLLGDLAKRRGVSKADFIREATGLIPKRKANELLTDSEKDLHQDGTPEAPDLTDL